MKFALFVLATALWVGTEAFLATRMDRVNFANAMDDPKVREELEEHLTNYAQSHEARLRDLGYPNYNCPGLMGKSKTVPANVNSVRPADINVVAALGDSLTAANGAGANGPIEVLLQYRGLAFQAGGDKNLDQHITIPNILKKYNPKLFGASKGIGAVNVWETAQLNAAVPGAQSGDLVGQARDLVHKMQIHDEVDINNDWKLINIFIGGNDICAVCNDATNHNDAHSAFNYANNIKQAIQILYDALPRVIVSITGMFQMQMLRQIDAGEGLCSLLHVFECKCESNAAFTNADIQRVCQAYQVTQMQLQTNGTFERNDFTVIVQPFLRDTSEPPLTANGKIDHGFFAPDCFHFAQYGHSMAAKGLWNNIVQPVGMKTTHYNLSNPTTALGCPDANCPFIRTVKNSANCAQYMTPGS